MLSLSWLLFLAPAVARSQLPLGYNYADPVKAYEPVTAELHTLSSTQFTSFAHPAFEGHSIRVKRAEGFCDPTVKAYTGYLDVDQGAKHLFFYFFESRSNPEKDDVLMWINGGPGCSSAMGLFMELGPCSVAESSTQGGNDTQWNPSSWNNNANLFFLDQPVGVGFSYADFGESVSTTEDAAKNVQAFVTIFFETFSQFKGRPFHMSGESYAGRYIPVFASEIVDQNARAEAAGVTPINLKSVLIGNGITDAFTMVESYYDIQCTGASVPPFQTIEACVHMKAAIPRCKKWLKEDCLDRLDAVGCGAALSFCDTQLGEPFFETGKNPYDVSKDCEGDIADTLCYPLTKRISNYLNKPSTRKLVGAEEFTGNFTSCSNAVGTAFSSTLDIAHPTYHYVTELLERGIKVLIYVGTYDWICNHVGNYHWTTTLEWSGHDAFNAEKLHEWKVDGKVVGKTQSAAGLTYATILGAGHMVPYDKPVESLALLSRWLNGEDL